MLRRYSARTIRMMMTITRTTAAIAAPVRRRGRGGGAVGDPVTSAGVGGGAAGEVEVDAESPAMRRPPAVVGSYPPGLVAVFDGKGFYRNDASKPRASGTRSIPGGGRGPSRAAREARVGDQSHAKVL